MIESFGYSFLEKQPFYFPMPAWKFNNRIAPFDTTTFEGVFPFMTSRFGKKIPTDLIMRVDRMWDVTCNNEVLNSTHKLGTINLKLDIDIEAKLVYDNSGVNKSVGHIEAHQTEFVTRIIQVNTTNFTV